jgi:drug/metabolite transporter (DMT)-like permease
MNIRKNIPKGKGGGYLALAITSIVWGTTWVASKIGLTPRVGELEIPALQMSYIRQFIAGGCFVLFFMIYKKLPLPNAKQFLWLLAMALLMFVFANGLSTWSLKFIPTGLSALIGALYPLVVVIIERIFFKSRNMNVLTFVGLLLGIAGIGIVFYENAFHHRSEGFFFGIGLSLFAMISWSIGTIIIARNKVDINPYYATGWQMLISSLLLFPIAETTQKTIPFGSISLIVWEVIIYLVVAGSLLAFIAFIFSMKRLPAAVASLYAYINPLVAMVTAAFLLDEKLTMYIIWGSVVTLAGVFIVNYSIKREREKIIAEPEL